MNWFNLHDFIAHWGLIGISFCVFAETGLLLGFFLPGESLLISAGIVAANHDINVWEVCVAVLIFSSLGNEVGYMIGSKIGPSIRKRPDGKILKQKHLRRADRYFERYGNRVILFCRFIPVVRTFGPLVAGITKMPRKAYTTYNIIGGAVWSFGVVFLGYFLGKTLEKHGINVDKYLLPIVLVVVAISLIPAVIEMRKEDVEILEPADDVEIHAPDSEKITNGN